VKTLAISVANPTAQIVTYGAGAVLSIERGAVVGGPYAIVGTLALAASQTAYAFADAAGEPTSWYRWRYRSADGLNSGAYSTPETADAGIITLADALAELGVTAATADATRVRHLVDGISSEIRKLCRRGFEGAATTYTETIRIRGALEFTLPHGPITSITSIAQTYVDGSEDEAYAADEYLIEDLDRCRVRLGTYFGPRAWPRDWARGPEYVKVVWTVTGEIPADVTLAAYQWLKARWGTWNDRPDLAGYKTGDDSESYFGALIGRMPRDVARALSLYYHATGGGPV
jgi:hypothetical protein